MPISLNPTTFVKGGLVSDVDVEITSARFTTYDYNGVITDPQRLVCALKLDYRVLGDDSGAVHTDYLSFGKVADFVPSDDGKTVESVSGKTPYQDTVFHLFMESLRKEGFDVSKLDSGDISVIDGMQVHIKRLPVPESWKSLNTGKGSEGPARERTYLAVTKILREGKGKAAGKPAAASAAKSEVSEELRERAYSEVLSVLSDAGKPMKIQSLQMMLIKRLNKLPADERKAVISLAGSPEFLAGRGFNVEDGMVSLPEEVPF